MVSNSTTVPVKETLIYLGSENNGRYQWIRTKYGNLRLRIDIGRGEYCYSVFGRFMEPSKLTQSFKDNNPRVNRHSLKFNFMDWDLGDLIKQLTKEIGELTHENL